jgi:hypothetical protein
MLGQAGNGASGQAGGSCVGDVIAQEGQRSRPIAASRQTGCGRPPPEHIQVDSLPLRVVGFRQRHKPLLKAPSAERG